MLNSTAKGQLQSQNVENDDDDCGDGNSILIYLRANLTAHNDDDNNNNKKVDR
jgi:hypothetical protein